MKVTFQNEPIMREQLEGYGLELEEKILLAPAFKKYKADEFEADADALKVISTPATEQQRPDVEGLRFRANLKVKRYSVATSLLKAVVEAHTSSANDLNNMCWPVYEEATKADSSVPQPLTAAALAGAERAAKLEPKESFILYTLAHLVSLTAEFDRAMAIETQAGENMSDEESQGPFRKSLKALEGKRAAASPKDK